MRSDDNTFCNSFPHSLRCFRNFLNDAVFENGSSTEKISGSQKCENHEYFLIIKAKKVFKDCYIYFINDEYIYLCINFFQYNQNIHLEANQFKFRKNKESIHIE